MRVLARCYFIISSVCKCFPILSRVLGRFFYLKVCFFFSFFLFVHFGFHAAFRLYSWCIWYDTLREQKYSIRNDCANGDRPMTSSTATQVPLSLKAIHAAYAFFSFCHFFLANLMYRLKIQFLWEFDTVYQMQLNGVFHMTNFVYESWRWVKTKRTREFNMFARNELCAHF